MYQMGAKVRYVNKEKHIHNKLAMIIGSDGMGLYQLQFESPCPTFQTAAYWEIELLDK